MGAGVSGVLQISGEPPVPSKPEELCRQLELSELLKDPQNSGCGARHTVRYVSGKGSQISFFQPSALALGGRVRRFSR